MREGGSRGKREREELRDGTGTGGGRRDGGREGDVLGR